jgi:hypothetical protein
MAWKGIVNRAFTPQQFADHVAGLLFTLWRPQFVVLHNTGAPTLAQWRSGPASPQQRILNLEHFYRDTQGWSAGPHLFIADDFIWAFTPLTVSGVHSPSWNAISWGIEMVGDYDREDFSQGPGGAVAANTVSALATLHTALSLDPGTLKLHKEDSKTTHDCPGRNVDKESMIARIEAAMGGDHPLGKIPLERMAREYP